MGEDSFWGGVGVVSQGAMGTLGGALGKMGSGAPRFEVPVQMREVAGERTLEMQLLWQRDWGRGASSEGPEGQRALREGERAW